MTSTHSLNDKFPSIGFIGAGNMAGAILRGAVGHGVLAAENVWACDIDEQRLDALSDELGVNTTTHAKEIAKNCDAIVFAVKPQQMSMIFGLLQGLIEPRHLVISIAAGVRIARIREELGENARIVRVMPNTPALVGEGAAGVAAGPKATPGDQDAVVKLFEAVGKAVAVEESLLDAVTALSGSGPAYYFKMMELMVEAGVKMGLDEQTSLTLTLQTCLGAAQLASHSDESPAELRRRVTSPNGTTEAALKSFDEGGLAGVIEAGILRARDRSIELSE